MVELIVDLFKKNGTEKVLSVITPFVINDPDKIFYIYKGRINLSSTKYINGKTKGRLYNFAFFDEGEIFFGFKQMNSKGLVFLADAEEDSIIYELPLSILKQEINNNKNCEKSFANYLDKWVTKIYDAINEDTTIITPPIQKNLPQKGTVKIDTDTIVSTNLEIVWLETDRIHHFLFNGHIKIKPQLKVFFPLTKRSFLKTNSNTEVIMRTTSTIISKNEFWDSLQLLHMLVLESDAYEANQYKILSEKILEKKYSAVQKELSTSIHNASSILTNTNRGVINTSDAVIDNIFFRTCKIVATQSSIELKIPPKLQNSVNSVENICRYSGIRYREIILEGDWYNQHGAGNFLGFLNGSNKPIALIYKKGKYHAIDHNNNSFIITSNNSYQIGRICYSFYKPLPKKKLQFFDLLKYAISKNKDDLKRLFITGFLTTSLALVLPILTAVLFDEIIPNAQRNQLQHITYALLMAALGGVLFEIAKNIAILRLRGILDSSLQVAIWDRILDLPSEFFRKFTAGDLAERTLGISFILNILSSITLNAIISGLFSVLNFFLLFYYSWILGAIALLVSIILLLVILILGRKQMKLQQMLLEEEGKISGLVFQLLTGINTLKATGNEVKAFIQWFTKYLESKQISFQVMKIQNLQRIITSSIYLLSLSFIYFSTINLLSKGITTGAFLSFNAAFGGFVMALVTLNDSLFSSIKVVPIYKRMIPILEELPENVGVKESPHQLKGEVELNNIHFRYSENTPYILNNVSIKINKGEFIALVGPSGSGKSTIIRLLLGFNSPEVGSILYDGHDLNNIDVKLLRQQIGVVLQDGSLIAGDIFSNIIGSSVNLTLNDAWEAARAAAFDQDINEMPMGMFTIVNDEGGTLSGGQKQRLMIARALVHKPKILIFDEATSALDNRTQAVVTKSLDNLQVTRIVVAHRLSTIINADRIIYLEDGVIQETGTFESLMSMKGKFFSLAQRQIE